MAFLEATLTVDINNLDFNSYVRDFASDEFLNDQPVNNSTYDFYTVITSTSFGVSVAGQDFAYNQNGSMVEGTVQAITELFNFEGSWYSVYQAWGFSVSMRDFRDAARTVTEDDDFALVGLAFSGNDNMTLSAFDDSWRGFGGNDRIYGQDGNDTIRGDGGNDKLFAGKGDDVVHGGSGHDQINGGSGADKLFGSKGRDTIKTGTGDDIATGGRGEDVFVFLTGDGADRVRDFDARGAVHDVIDLSGVASIKHWKDLRTYHMEQVGDDVVINARGGDTITLDGVNLADLDKGDFIF